MPAPLNTPFEFETVAVPVAAGVDTRTRHRALDAAHMLRAENTRWPADAGPERRYGHEDERPRTAPVAPALNPAIVALLGLTVPAQGADPLRDGVPTTGHGERDPFDPATVLPANWLHGWGLFEPGTDFVGPLGDGTRRELLAAESRDDTYQSEHEEVGVLTGIASREDEVVVVDGFRMLSRSPSGPRQYKQVGTNFPPFQKEEASLKSMPWLRTATIAKGSGAQSHAQAAETATTRMVVWTGDGAFLDGRIYDRATGAVIDGIISNDTAHPLFPITNDGGFLDVRLMPVGSYIHLAARTNNNNLWLASYNTNTHTWWRVQNTGAATHFDIRTYRRGPGPAPNLEHDGLIAVRRVAGAPATLLLTNFFADGTVDAGLLGNGFSIDLGGDNPSGLVSVDIHPVTGHIGVAWLIAGPAVHGRTYLLNGTNYSTAVENVVSVVNCPAAPVHLTIAAQYLVVDGGGTYATDNCTDTFDVYVDGTRTFGGSSRKVIVRKALGDANEGNVNVAPGCYLASHAFRVGHRTYVLAVRPEAQTSQYYLLDRKFVPVGCFSTGTAEDQAAYAQLISVNTREPGPAKDQMVFHCATTYRNRTGGDVAVNFTEMDFLPPLRSAAIGRAVYFPGAQLWSYDGEVLSEASPLWAPEALTFTPDAVSGSLTPSTTYRYRVYVAWRNALGEEVRGPGLQFTSATGVAQTRMVIGLNPGPIGRLNSSSPFLPYYLIYRNEGSANGTLFYLVSSRNPADATYSSVADGTFNDGLSDANLVTKELDPANVDGFVQTFAAPACEAIAVGAGRAWVFGGEVPQGAVRPSRTYLPGEIPTYNPLLEVRLDRTDAPVTAVSFLAEQILLFREDRTYLLDPNGISNVAAGVWKEPRLAFGDTGARSQDGTLRTDLGVLFQSPAGIQLLTPGGQLTPIGARIEEESAAARIRSAMYVRTEKEARFYTRSGPVLVLNVTNGEWALWTGLESEGAVLTDNGAVLAREDGWVWLETAGLYSDAGQVIPFAVQCAFLTLGAIDDFQVVRRIGAVGEFLADHTVHIRVFYDGRDFPEEEFDWTPTTGGLNPSFWGAATWGAGVWGDALAPVGASVRDRVWDFTRRVHRQRCSSISFELSESTITRGFAPVAFLLELGKRRGLNRRPQRIFT